MLDWAFEAKILLAIVFNEVALDNEIPPILSLIEASSKEDSETDAFVL